MPGSTFPSYSCVAVLIHLCESTTKKGEQKRREMERKLRKEKWETKVSFQSPERRAHFLYCIFYKKEANENHVLQGRIVHPTQLAL